LPTLLACQGLTLPPLHPSPPLLFARIPSVFCEIQLAGVDVARRSTVEGPQRRRRRRRRTRRSMVSGRDGADWWWWNAADRGPECTSATSSLFTRHATRDRSECFNRCFGCFKTNSRKSFTVPYTVIIWLSSTCPIFHSQSFIFLHRLFQALNTP